MFWAVTAVCSKSVQLVYFLLFKFSITNQLLNYVSPLCLSSSTSNLCLHMKIEFLVDNIYWILNFIFFNPLIVAVFNWYLDPSYLKWLLIQFNILHVCTVFCQLLYEQVIQDCCSLAFCTSPASPTVYSCDWSSHIPAPCLS